MNLHRTFRGIEGVLILVSLILAVFFSYWWLLLTLLIGIDLLQSAFTDSSPIMWVLQKMGFKSRLMSSEH